MMNFPNTYDTIIEELSKGHDSAIRLSELLQEASSTDQANSTTRNLVSEVTSSFTRALMSLKHEDLGKKMEMPRKLSRRRCYQKSSQPYSWRRNKTKTLDDGYSWRKYGQKPIQDAKFPRSYFRCRYKQDQNCNATRQVQQSEEDPSVFLITYFGEHTCTKDTSKPLSPILKEEEDNKLIIDFSSKTSMSSSQFWKYECDDREIVISSSNEDMNRCFSEFGELGMQSEDVTSGYMQSFAGTLDWEMMDDSLDYHTGLYGFEHMQDEWFI